MASLARTFQNLILFLGGYEHGSGTNVPDQSKNTNDATTFGTVTRVDDGGDCFELDGSSGYIDLVHTDLEIGVNVPKTYSIWFKRDGTPSGDEYILSSINTAGTDLMSAYIDSSGYVNVEADDGSDPFVSLTDSINYANNVWHNLVITIEWTGAAYTIAAYVDGTQIGINTASLESEVSNSDEFLLGAVWGSGGANQTPKRFFLDGRLDTFVVFNRILNLAEIQGLYTDGRQPKQRYHKIENTVLHFRPTKEGDSEQYVSGDGADVTDLISLETGTLEGAVFSSNNDGLYFDGVNDYMTFANQDWFDFGTGAFAVSFWMELDTISGYSLLFDKRETSAPFTGWAIYIDSFATGELVIQRNGTSQTTQDFTGFVPSANVKYHVIANFKSNGDCELFVDGVSTQTLNFGSQDVDNTEDLIIGSGFTPPSNVIEGVLDDIRIFNREITQEEATYLYNNGVPGVQVNYDSLFGFLSGCAHFWSATHDDTAADLIGNNDGTYVGDAAAVEETSNNGLKAFEFDGSGDRVDLDSTINLPNNSDWSIAFWAQQDTEDNDGMIVGNMSGTGDYIWVRGSSNIFEFNGGSSFQFTLTDDTTDWHHYAVVYDWSTGTSGDLKFYLDGVLQDTQTVTGSLVITAFGDGYSTGALALDGTIDGLGIWNRDLTSAEVAILATGRWVQPKKEDSDLDSHFLLDEDLANDNVSDYSGNENDGSMVEGNTEDASVAVMSLTPWLSAAMDMNTSTTTEHMTYTATQSANLTVMAFIKPESDSAYPVIVGETGGTDDGFRLWRKGANDRICFSINTWNTNEAESPFDIVLSTEYHCAGSYDGANCRVWIDGIEGTPAADAGPITWATVDSPAVGNQSGWNQFDGPIADVARFNRTCATTEIDAHRLGPISYWTIQPSGSITSTTFTGNIGDADSINGDVDYEWSLHDADTNSRVATGYGTTPSSTGVYSGDYYLMVRAINNAGPGEWVESETFTVSASSNDGAAWYFYMLQQIINGG